MFLRMLAPQLADNGRLTRREILRVGGLFGSGLTLAELLRLDAVAGDPQRVRGRSIINVHLDGGPPQLDTIDLKPGAAAEIRGEFQPIETSVPGVQICELMPQLAAGMSDLVLVRSLVGSAGAHNAFQCQSGFGDKDLKSLGGRPAMGSVISRLEGSPHDPAPAFVDLMQGRPLVRNSARPGFLGPAYQPFRPDISHLFQRELEDGMKNELARLGMDHSTSLTLNTSLSHGRLQDRTQLLAGLDRLRRDVDASGMMSALDQFNQQAVGILTSGRLAAAMDLDAEDADIRRRYELAESSGGEQFYTADGSNATLKFLMARRLIEAGVRCVSISISDFDTHSKNFPRLRNLLPIFDHGLATLIDDLKQRGMLDDVLIVCWGEFGRTPRIDPKTGGRHHWPRVGPAILAGGSLPGGQVIGATDRTGSEARERPVSYKDVFCSLYQKLGIDARRTTLMDPQGRPQYLLDSGEPLAELA